ncbi:hypothetical protein FQA39_LY10231 [Lamprigera yunnana]|nr:hypothetical protein FQA39_LY10231 [Lamprigera yunnana]
MSTMDEVKHVFIIPQKILTAINLWPESSNGFKKITFSCILLFLIALELGQVCYLIRNINDVTAIAATISTMSTTFQAICKSSVVFFNNKRLEKVIKITKKNFWNADRVGDEIKQTILFYRWVVGGNMVLVLISAFVFAIGFLSKPLREGEKELPLLSLYPFDSKQSPFYEGCYIFQVVGDMYFSIISTCGHDDLFLTLSLNCITQFMILKEEFTKVGKSKIYRLNLQNNRETFKYQHMYTECIEQHILLLRIYNEIEKIFSFSNFIQLLCSVAAICVSSFLIVLEGEAQILHLSSYCLGHILQLFLCCSAASELTYHSQNLAHFEFNSSWYTNKDLATILMASQKPKRIFAMGIVEINYATFISVLKLSFSFYTLLSNIVAK